MLYIHYVFTVKIRDPCICLFTPKVRPQTNEKIATRTRKLAGTHSSFSLILVSHDPISVAFRSHVEFYEQYEFIYLREILQLKT